MAQKPQLRMGLADFDRLPPLALPDGCSVRPYRTGDERAWAALLQENGELGAWSVERAEAAFQGGSRVWRESIHFVFCAERPVATACVQLHDADPRVPELGWVAVAPDQRGRGLGRAVSLAVLHFMREQGYERCFLRTDDHRLAAIRLYLRLGFEPDMSQESYPARWQAVYRALGAAGEGGIRYG